MNKVLTVIFGLLTTLSFGQRKQKVDLDWRIGKEEKLSYLTVMSDIDTSSIEMNFGGLFKSFSDSTGEAMTEVKEIFKKLNSALRSVDLVTTLENKGVGVIDITMVANQNENNARQSDSEKQKDIERMLQTMKGIVLRGSVYESGGIHSFWTKSSQKNLISVFFELPVKAVQVGDSWELDVDLISNDQNFECDSSYRRNKVTMRDIRNVNGENIATLQYEIIEYVKGKFSAPSVSGPREKTETMMKFTYQAVAEFSIDKGRWLSYDGIMSLVASGIMTGNKKTKFALIKV